MQSFGEEASSQGTRERWCASRLHCCVGVGVVTDASAFEFHASKLHGEHFGIGEDVGHPGECFGERVLYSRETGDGDGDGYVDVERSVRVPLCMTSHEYHLYMFSFTHPAVPTASQLCLFLFQTLHYD